VRKGFPEIVFPEIGMGIQVKEPKVGVDFTHGFDDRKGDQVVAPKENGEFLLG
jgi:hypothetical protein